MIKLTVLIISAFFLFWSFLPDDIDSLGLSSEELIRSLLTVYQYLVSKAELRRILLIIDAKNISFRDLRKFGPDFGLKLPAIFTVK